MKNQMKNQLTPAGARRIIRQYLAGTLEHRRDGSSPLYDALVVLLRQGASKATTGRARRRKGHDYEREIARIFQGLWPGAKRGLQGRDGGDAPDVDGTPWWIECKRLKAIGAVRYLEQAEAATDGRPVLVIMREDGGQDVAMVHLDVLLTLLPLLPNAKSGWPA